MGDYSDDDLDDLPDSVLQELENNAIQSTQAHANPHHARPKPAPPPKAAPPANPRHQYDTLGLSDDDLDFDGSEVFNNSLGAIPRPAPVQPVVPQARAVPSFTRPPNPPQQQRWNKPAAPAVPQSHIRPPAAPQRFQQPPARPQASQFPRGFAPPPPRYAPSQSHHTLIHPNAVDALEKRLRALEADLAASRGEASILRANAAKAAQAHEAEVARLKKVAAEQQARHAKEVQSAQVAERHAATELQFLQRDMQEVANRARRKDATSTSNAVAGVGTGTGATTPKRAARSWGVADGFDGMDLVPSPSKANIARPKSTGAVAGEKTPKGKRKRVVDSPVLPLDTHTQGDAVMLGSIGESKVPPPRPVPQPGPVSLYSLPVDFLPLILDHASAHGQPPTFDTFSQYFFPSDPKTSFSSIIFQSLPTLSDPTSPLKILKDFSVLTINLWSRCLEEEFFIPIRELVSLLSFTLQLHSLEIVPELLEALLPVAQPTLYVIADLQNPEGNLHGNPDLPFLQASLDSTAIIALLNLCAQACAASGRDGEEVSPRVTFWKKFGMDTVAFVLGARQPIWDIVGMLEILTTSVQPTSIGPILPDRTPEQVAANLLDKLTKLLISPPLGARTASQRHAVSVAVLQTLLSFTTSEFALVQMARHDNLILRLIACLARSVDELYDQEIWHPALPPHEEPEWNLHQALAGTEPHISSDVPGLCRVLSLATQILHTLVTDPRTAVEVRLEGKFESWRAGAHKYLVMLCRLNFADDELWLERGVDVETAERAHELLEGLVDPGRGRDIGEAFGTPDD